MVFLLITNIFSLLGHFLSSQKHDKLISIIIFQWFSNPKGFVRCIRVKPMNNNRNVINPYADTFIQTSQEYQCKSLTNYDNTSIWESILCETLDSLIVMKLGNLKCY